MLDKTKLRLLMRKGENAFITQELVCNTYELAKKKGQELLKELERTGYIETTNIKDCWSITMRGKVLAQQKFERSYTVQAQKEHLQLFLERIPVINSSPEFPHLVGLVKIISEYPILNKNPGLHIVYSLIRKKMSQEKYEELSRKLRRRSKRYFYNIIAKLIYPEIAIYEALKARSPLLKLRKVEVEEMEHFKGYILFDIQTESANNLD